MDWLDELQQIRSDDEDKRKSLDLELDLEILGRRSKSENALMTCQAHQLLRHTNNVLLLGKGVLDFFDTSKRYDRIIALVWQGSVSEARKPNRNDDSDYFYIIVGAKGYHVYCNHKLIGPTTPESLKSAIVKAAKNPLRQKRKNGRANK